MLEELDAVFRTALFENNGGLFVASVRWPGRGCELAFVGRATDARHVLAELWRHTGR